MANGRTSDTDRASPRVGRAMALLSLGLTLSGSPARADQPLIGVAAPLTGPSARLGAQVRAGADGRAPSGRRPTLAVKSPTTAVRPTAAPRQRASWSPPRSAIVVGFLCTEAIEAAMPILKDAGIPVITVGVRTDSLTDGAKDRLAGVPADGPRADDEQKAAAKLIPSCGATGLLRHHRRRHHLRPRARREAARGSRGAALKPVFVDTVPTAARQPDRPCRPAAQGRRDACLRRRRSRRHRHHRPRRQGARADAPLPAARRCAPPPARSLFRPER